MIICAIDPGPTHSAMVCWCTDTQAMLSHGIYDNTASCLRTLGRDGEQVVIEDIVGYGQRVGAEVFLTCKWIGRLWERCVFYDCVPVFISRPAVLRALGIAPGERGKDALVRGHLIARFGPTKAIAIGHKATPGPLYGIKADEWSALALALVYVERIL